MRTKVDWRLYLVIDPAVCMGRPMESVLDQAVDGGVTVVQLRMKDCSGLDYYRQAQRAHDLLHRAGVPLIVNDRVDVALAVGAEGVHVGQSDIPATVARQLMGEDAIIGLSADTPEQVEEAEAFDVDCLGVGPVYPTGTKSNAGPALGCDGLRRLRAHTRHALIAIGGINRDNAAEVVRAGPAGIAVVSAICGAPDPAEAARELRRIVDGAAD
jgi:thiamine-phosphate pyrophosphorylase